jgi:DNA-binding transcriptional MocR family regulator
MTIWQPDLESHAGPRYLAIAEALAGEIDAGNLKPGDRLPTHRDLAYRLGVTVGTVSRAYAVAERRGLVVGEVGRGTFVRRPASAARELVIADAETPGVIDLTPNRPVPGAQGQALAATLAALAARESLEALVAYQPDAGAPEHRAAGAAWIARQVPGASPERVVVTGGAQHAIAVTLAALADPGDVVLTEALTWPGIKALANLLHLRLEGLTIDGDGLLPEDFAAACRSRGARVLYCMPTLHNPTTATLSAARRTEIVEIARRYDVAIIEDDVYGFLPESAPPPLAALAPERTYYLSGASKSLAPGLRVGFVLAPEGKAARVAAGVRATTFMTPPLNAEVVATWIADGTAERLIEWQRDEARARQSIAASQLVGIPYASGDASFHVWLELPAPWRADDFVDQARSRGVAVAPADIFAAGRAPAPHAVRIALSAPAERASLERALGILAEILRAPPAPRLAVV